MSKLYKIIFILVLLHCKTVAHTGNIYLTENVNSLKAKNFALIGFKPFKKAKGEYVLHPIPEIMESFPSGKYYTEYPTQGIDKSVSHEKIFEFLKEYSAKVGTKNVILELNDLVEVNSEGKLQLKKREVDYYVVGIFGPKHRKGNNLLEKIFFGFIWIYTYTILPYFEFVDSEFEFKLYDKNFNLLDTYSGSRELTLSSNWYFLKSEIKDGILIGDYQYYTKSYSLILMNFLGKQEPKQ